MKNLLIIATFLFSTAIFTNCQEETVISAQNLPTEIKEYIEIHFVNSTITHAEKIRNEREKYKVILSSGFKLEFDKENRIIEISGSIRLPDSVIPTSILSYVNSTYLSNHIISWESKSKKQEVKLDNGLELIFDNAGQFQRIDD